MNNKIMMDVGKILLGIGTVGSAYLLGAFKGMKIGHAQGRVDGFGEATRYMVEKVQQSVHVEKGE